MRVFSRTLAKRHANIHNWVYAAKPSYRRQMNGYIKYLDRRARIFLHQPDPSVRQGGYTSSDRCPRFISRYSDGRNSSVTPNLTPLRCIEWNRRHSVPQTQYLSSTSGIMTFVCFLGFAASNEAIWRDGLARSKKDLLSYFMMETVKFLPLCVIFMPR